MANIFYGVLTLTKDELSQSVGANVRLYRKKLQLTQDDLADAAGISVPFCAQIEAGKRAMSLHVFCMVADALNVSADALIYGERREASQSSIAVMIEDMTDEQVAFTEDLLRLISDKLW